MMVKAFLIRKGDLKKSRIPKERVILRVKRERRKD